MKAREVRLLFNSNAAAPLPRAENFELSNQVRARSESRAHPGRLGDEDGVLAESPDNLAPLFLEVVVDEKEMEAAIESASAGISLLFGCAVSFGIKKSARRQVWQIEITRCRST